MEEAVIEMKYDAKKAPLGKYTNIYMLIKTCGFESCAIELYSFRMFSNKIASY